MWSAVAEVEAELGDGGRVLLRPSGTEPLVRVMVEARRRGGRGIADAGKLVGRARRLRPPPTGGRAARPDRRRRLTGRAGQASGSGRPVASASMCGIIGATGADDVLPRPARGAAPAGVPGLRLGRRGPGRPTAAASGGRRAANGTRSLDDLCKIDRERPGRASRRHRPHPVGHPRPARPRRTPTPISTAPAVWPSSTTGSSRTTPSWPTSWRAAGHRLGLGDRHRGPGPPGRGSMLPTPGRRWPTPCGRPSAGCGALRHGRGVAPTSPS